MKISVLTPAWNEETHLPEMIQSVIDQSYEDWELLLVDDGSSDGTADVIRRFAELDERVKPVSLGVKMGKTAAFNLAYERSDGEVVCLAGADDVLPSDALQIRASAMAGLEDKKAAGFFKIRTFSDDPKYDGAVIPKGNAGSRSGGSLTVTRAVGDQVFPVPTSLPSEDLWLGQGVEAVAETIVDDPGIVLNYRIHPGNTNPRHLPFEQLNEHTRKRAVAMKMLLEQRQFELPVEQRCRLELLWQAEEYRYRGKTMEILRLRRLPLIDRLAVAQASSPALRTLRTKLYRFTTGWRGR